jgi:ABC-type branched-subunit amino acid transport system ATPase component
MADRPGLEVSELTIRFGGLTAVDSLSLAAPRGQITGLIGPNGAGKSTTFNACCGLLAPSTGRVTFDGADVTSMRPERRARLGLGRTFQRMDLFWSVTVEANVALGLEARLAGGSPLRHLWSRRSENVEIERATAEAIELCGLGRIADQPVARLSTGQRRLVELARAIAGGFDVLLLDEPSSGLDPSETRGFGDILLHLVRERGTGILLVEHDMELVMSCCSQNHVIDCGVSIFVGTPAETPASPVGGGAYLGPETIAAAGA